MLLTEEPGESDHEGHHGGQILALLCPLGKFLNLSEPVFSCETQPIIAVLRGLWR